MVQVQVLDVCATYVVRCWGSPYTHPTSQHYIFYCRSVNDLSLLDFFERSHSGLFDSERVAFPVGLRHTCRLHGGGSKRWRRCQKRMFRGAVDMPVIPFNGTRHDSRSFFFTRDDGWEASPQMWWYGYDLCICPGVMITLYAVWLHACIHQVHYGKITIYHIALLGMSQYLFRVDVKALFFLVIAVVFS